MEPNKPIEAPEDGGETYTPRQRAILKILKLGAWTASFTAMLYVMRS
jgi:hypothetical protein